LRKNSISSYKIAAIYIGTVVGAGFASGQEILQFFVYHGKKGILGLLIVTLLFVFYGNAIFFLGNCFRASSYKKVVFEIAGPIIGKVIDIVIAFFLFGALSAMIAGAGAIFKEQYCLPYFLGSLIMAVLAVLTVIRGMEGVISAISSVVPLLLTAVIVLSILAIFYLPGEIYKNFFATEIKPPVKNFILSAILYASYNLLTAAAVLIPLGSEVENIEGIRKGALLGGIGLGTMSFLMFFALIKTPFSFFFEVPMLYIASRISPFFKFVYTLILIGEIYTTAVGNLYGFVVRFVASESKRFYIFTVITGGIALVSSRVGFANLVHHVYPIAGYGGLILLLSITYKLNNCRKM